MHPDSRRFESHNSLIIQRRSKRKKISTLLRYRFSFDGSWLAPRYPDISWRGLAGFFCQGNTKFRVFLLFLTQTNKLPTLFFASYRCAIGLAVEIERVPQRGSTSLKAYDEVTTLNRLFSPFIFFSFIIFNFFLLEKIISRS